MALRLVGTSEIRRLLGGVSKQRAYEISRRAGFPEPVAVLDSGRIWLAEDVERWIAEHRKLDDE